MKIANESKFLQHWELHRKKGIFIHSLKIAALWGVPVFLIMTFIVNSPSKSVIDKNIFDLNLVVTNFLIYFTCSFFLGAWDWHYKESKYKKIKGSTKRIQTDLEEAENSIKTGYLTTMFVGIIQTLILGYVVISKPESFTSILDIIFLFFAATILYYKKSRFIAVILLLYSILIFYMTFTSRFGIGVYGLGGKNLFLSLVLVYAGYKALDGTLKYHNIIGTSINSKNVIRLIIAIFLYALITNFIFILGTGYLLMNINISVSVSENIMGAGMIFLIFLVSVLAAFRKLPFTKNLKTTNP